MYGMSVNAAPCVGVILTMREMSVILTQIDLLSVKLTHSRVQGLWNIHTSGVGFVVVCEAL